MITDPMPWLLAGLKVLTVVFVAGVTLLIAGLATRQRTTWIVGLVLGSLSLLAAVPTGLVAALLWALQHCGP